MAANLLNRVAACGVVPVVTVENAHQGVALAKALKAGGIDVIEVTLRTPGALDAMKAIIDEVPDVLTIAGTVVNPAQVRQVREAGASLVVSPGFTESVAEAMTAEGLSWLPGVATASDVMRAVEAGWTTLKFFPAEQSGGVAMLKAFGGPFHQIRFCPTGGIGLANAPTYLKLPNVICVGGSWMVPAKAISEGEFAAIETLAREASQMARTARA